MIKRLILLAITTVLIAFALWRLPSHIWRSGGTVDLVLLIDTSGSTAKQLPAFRDAACQMVGALREGDRLAVIWFDAEARSLYTGTIGSAQALNVVQQQIRSLSVSDLDGTVLPEALAQAGDAFEEFTGKGPSSLKRRRVLVLFSDGQSSPVPGTAAEKDWDEVHLPSLTTVLALGFEGVPQDLVVQTLLGPGAADDGRGTNDVHLISMQEAKPAVGTTLSLIRRAHPLNWGRIALVAVGLLLWALCVLFLKWPVVSSPRRFSMQPVKVRVYGSDDERETFLAVGESFTLGRRQEIPLPTDSIAVLSRENSAFRVAPKSPQDKVAIIREGKEIPVVEPTVLHPGDLVQIDGLQIEIDFSSSEA